MTTATATQADIEELRGAIKHFIDHEKTGRRSRDKTTLINHCTAALIYFTQEGFDRNEIRAEVVAYLD